MSEKTIDDFVASKKEWIEKHVEAFSNKHEKSDSGLYYLGNTYSLRFISEKKNFAHWNGKEFLLSEKLENNEQKKESLINWYKKEAFSYLSERVITIAKLHNFTYRNIKITSAERRWGSCSSKNDINFPWRLLMAPPDVIDYVVVHELSHTVHKNHSNRFWGLVESIMPDWRKHRDHLRKEGWKYDITDLNSTL